MTSEFNSFLHQSWHGIAFIFLFFFLQNISKINKLTSNVILDCQFNLIQFISGSLIAYLTIHQVICLPTYPRMFQSTLKDSNMDVFTTGHSIYIGTVNSFLCCDLNYPIVASTNTCYYSKHHIFLFLKSRIVTWRIFFFREKPFLFVKIERF